MPFLFFIEEAAVWPLKAIIFQSLLLLVAIALEAIVLRQRLRLGFQPSVRYAASLNLLATVLGWVLFLLLEPLLPTVLRTQVMSYILFGQFYDNDLTRAMGALVMGTGLGMFFLTFSVKAKGLELLTKLLGNPIVPPQDDLSISRSRARGRRRLALRAEASPHIMAVLQANALSFSVILLLLLLRYGLEGQA
jgi:hypothetical protein